MSNAELPKVNVGDMLAFDTGRSRHAYKLVPVTKITPSGRIICGGHTLNPDLTIRGLPNWSTGPSRAQVVTPAILQAVEKDRLIWMVIKGARMDRLETLTIEQLTEACKALGWNLDTPPEEAP